jgi:glycosyltransferase involved in cell wall biosynthesis
MRFAPSSPLPARLDSGHLRHESLDAMPRISVIVPFYNRKLTLDRCLESLLAQDYPGLEYEVIAVDNNSNDGSDAIARRYPRITLLHEGKQGSYAARNCGLRTAAGEFVAFTDSDCVAAPDWLSKIDQAMRDARLQIVVGNSRPAGQSRAIRLLGAYEEHKDRYVFSTSRSEKYYGHTRNMAIRRSAFTELGPFVEWQRGADSAFVRRAVDRFGCEAVHYDSGIFVRHLELESAVTYFKKTYLYGRARQLGNRIVAIEALSTGERLRVFLATTRDEPLSAINASMLLALLIVGAGCWYAGNFSASAIRSQASR